MEEGVLEGGETAGRNGVEMGTGSGVEMGTGSGSEGGGVGTNSAPSGGTSTETGHVHVMPGAAASRVVIDRILGSPSDRYLTVVCCT